MKKAFILIILFLSTKLYAQYQTIETFNNFYTQIILCTDSKKDYVLINNGYSEFPEYLIIFSDKKYSARQVYGEILLKYYRIKNAKKEIRQKDGEFYYKNLDNAEEEMMFLRFMTDEFILLDYNVFYLDDNTSKDEKIEFYDIAEDLYREDTVGSSAGILMGINAADFLKALGDYGNGL